MAEPPAAGAGPLGVPFQAAIASFEPGDGVGTLKVEGSPAVRFGRSACRGFEPAVGLSVEVRAMAPHPLGGFRASEVALRSDAATYDSLLEQRDAALGVETRSRDPLTVAAATAQVLGWIIVLLREPPPRGPGQFSEWAQRIGLVDAGIRVDIKGGDVVLGVGRHTVLTYVGDGPFPAEKLAALGVPQTVDIGKGFIGLSLGLPGLSATRGVTGPSAPWAEDGSLRALSRIARALSAHGPAVILPQAGAVVPAEVFKRQLGALDDARSRPFRAWISVALGDSDYSTYGMVLHGLPNVVVATDEDPWQLDRAREALLAACSTMVHANRALAPGDRLSVPIGALAGATPLEVRDGDDVETYVVEPNAIDEAQVLQMEIGLGVSLRSGWIRLRKTSDARAEWARVKPKRPRIALNTYQLLVLRAVAARLAAEHLTDLTPRVDEGAPQFNVDVHQARDGFFMVTNGLGRVAQRFGAAAGKTDHVELIAAMQAHHPLLANVIAEIGKQIHRQADASGVFKSGDTLGFEVSEIGAAGFVLADAGNVSIAEGPPVHLLEVIPLSSDEIREARERGSGEVLARLGAMSPPARGARWKLKQPN